MFLRLRAASATKELLDLGRNVEAVKKSVPTRHRPGAPERPPAGKIPGPVTGMFDRPREGITHGGTIEPRRPLVRQP